MQVCKNYVQITTPLIRLLKKESFSLTQEATQAFKTLKVDMCTTPILTMLDFTKTFIVESNASGHDICVVLM